MPTRPPALILGPSARLRPAFVEIPVLLEDELALTMLASIISLTPGTVSADLSDDRKTLLVHSLDVADAATLVRNGVRCVAEGANMPATLEAALFKRPMVISYAVNWLSYRIMKPKQLQPWLGLPNILCGDFVVPELMQHEAKPEALATALLDWLDSPARMAAVQEKFMALHHTLQRDTVQLATDAIEQVLEN